MSDFAVTRRVEHVQLEANAVLGEAWRLYKRLFARSVVLGAIVFGVPVAMLEEGNARGALRRSREIVAGNGWPVFRVLLAVGLLTFLVEIPFLLVASGAGLFGWWVATTLASALTAPYAAHALTVVYYGLVQPGRPVVLPPGQRWQSVWKEQDDAEGRRRDQPS